MNNSERLKTPPQSGTPLLIKELATALGVSTRFVYLMRARGFPMRGDTRQRQMATLAEARVWISANNFRIIHGYGVTNERRIPTKSS